MVYFVILCTFEDFTNCFYFQQIHLLVICGKICLQ